MLIFIALLIGLVIINGWGLESGFYAALFVYLAGTVYQQRQRLQILEEKVRHLAADLSAIQRVLRTEGAAAARSEHESESKMERVSPAKRAVAESGQDEEPLKLDVDFDRLDEPTAPSRPARVSRERPLKPAPVKGLENRLLDWLKGYFTSGNLIVRVGVVVLFFGVAFLLKYAADHSLLPIELRLIATALGGMLLLIFGWRLREKRRNYALSLQGGAVGVLYLTVFAALRLYDLMPPGLAFALLLLFVTLSAMLALLQDAKALSVLATAGGFLAPVLTSTGAGSHVALFSYYLLLNGGILLIAWFKAWRILNLLGFAFTFVIGAFWGAQYYRPEYFASTEPFLLAFFLLYVGVALLFALRQPPDLKGIVDGSLVFGVPLVSAGLQAALVKDYPYGLAFSALALGGFYTGLGSLLFKRGSQALRMLAESFLATGVVFTTLAVPFAFEGRITSAFWSLEGAAILWIGLRQSRLLPRLFGSLLQLLAGLFYLVDATRLGEDLPLLNGLFMGTLLIALAGLFSSFYLERLRERIGTIEQILIHGFFLWGILWWLGGCMREIEDFVLGADRWAWLLGVLTLTAVLSEWLKPRLPWQRLSYVGLGLLPLLLLTVLGMALELSHFLIGWTAAAWLAALAAHYWLLRHYDEFNPRVIQFWHAGAFWLLTFLLASEASWRLAELIPGGSVWRLIPWGIVPMALVWGLLRLGPGLAWPVGRFRQAYMTLVPAPLMLYLLVWSMLANMQSNADPQPLSYLPLLNPLDLTILFCLLLALQWWRHAADWLIGQRITLARYLSVVGGLLFLWLNGMVARTVHHWAGVTLDAGEMFRSQVFQASISVLWALLGLGGMLLGSSMKKRYVWLLGAGLMGLVVVKLFLVDLSNTGTVARIVSFLCVGLLLLLVGYFSPVPPRHSKEEREA